jgi:beta-galactosidase
MNRRTFCALLPIAAGTVGCADAAAQSQPARERLVFDHDWKFAVGDTAGAEAPSYDAGGWRTVDLPHDWSIEGKIDPKNPMGGSGGFLPTGVGWYRRAFNAPAAWKGKRVSVEFEGVYMNATVYVNGQSLGMHPYGYTSFVHDVTPHLKFGVPNVVAVRVDQSQQPNTRWYAGSGIYRHVWLHVADPVHVVQWGVFVTTPEVSAARAKVSVKTRVANDSSAPTTVTVRTILYSPTGAAAGQTDSTATIKPGDATEVTQDIAVARPSLWAPETPSLYRAVTRVMSGGKAMDEVTTPFGIRSLEWSVEKGLLLNGRVVKLTGGCVHHDNGPLGVAALDRAEERRVQILKAAGFNAIRTSHNPPSPGFLDACDRLGMLILDEAFDTWERPKKKFDYSVAFKEWWQRDIESMVLRDRNHPSVVLWSIGNEIGERGEEQGAVTAKLLADHIRTLDRTRPITSALNGVRTWSATDPYYAALDLGGYNYNLANHVEDHKRVPSRIMMSTESFLRQTFDYWALVTDNPYIVGDFVWTAMDYIGESGIGRWDIRDASDTTTRAPGMGSDQSYPVHASDCGDIDLCGFRKSISHYRNIVWDRGEKIYLGVRMPEPEGKRIVVSSWGTWPTYASWTWPGQEGKPVQAEVYSRCEKVRLYLDDKLIGEKPTTRAEQFKATFSVPYAPGVLKAVGFQGDKPVAETTLRTAGQAVQVRLTADRARLRADGQDLAYLTVEAVDSNGQPQPNADHEISFTVTGPGAIAGVGNGDIASEEVYHGNRRKLFHGKALVIVRTARTAGTIELTASGPGLKSSTLRIQTQAVQPRSVVA